MLEWWWENYSKHNDLPVAFANFGMSRKAINFCQSRGILINLTQKTGKRNWFKKPFAMLGCPFNKVAWLDLDCEIRGKINPLFEYAKKGRIAVTLDPHNPWVKTRNCVASGIVVAEHGNTLIERWATSCLRPNRLRGDQEVLNSLIHDDRNKIAIMPPEYQWLRLDGDNPRALIMHWTGAKGKNIIRLQMGMNVGHRARAKIKASGAGRSKRIRSLLNQKNNRVSPKRTARIKSIKKDR